MFGSLNNTSTVQRHHYRPLLDILLGSEVLT